MAPLPPNNTMRLFLEYTSRGIRHTTMVRLPSDTLPGEAEQFAQDLADALKGRMLEADSIYAARLGNAGSDVTLPIAFEPVQGVLTSAGNVWGQDPESTFLSIVGRSGVSGRRNRLEFYLPTSTASWPADNRYNPGDDANIDLWSSEVRAILDGAGASEVAAVSIDGSDATWYTYTNIAQNAYWQRKQRRGV